MIFSDETWRVFTRPMVRVVEMETWNTIDEDRVSGKGKEDPGVIKGPT